jgi:hypothetical protein
MRKTFDSLLMFSIAVCALLFGTVACATDYPAVPTYPVAPSPPAVQGNPEVLFSPAQLDNLVAPVALYPDPLLAQVVVAATFPEQIDEAARFLRAGANPRAIDAQPWDVSVKAVSHYPTVLYMMADNLDWTTSLGQAYAEQSTDVMAAVQRLRVRARASGYLVTTPQMEVVVENSYISLWPVYPQTLYVPVYDPALVFYYPSGYRVGPVISFGVGFAVGSWLIYDCDWHRHRVYYHGWAPRRRWVRRYRPHVHISNVYVHNRHSHVRYNRHVVHHSVNYHALGRYNAVHRHVRYDNVRRRPPRFDTRGGRREHRAPDRRRDVDNKVIRRNFDPDNPRIDSNRGRQFIPRPVWPIPGKHPRPAPQQRQPRSRRDVRTAPERRQSAPQRDVRPAPRRRQTRPRVGRPRSGRQERQIQRRDNSVFRGRRTDIDPRAARQRGQSSRRQMGRSRSTTRPSVRRRRVPSHR